MYRTVSTKANHCILYLTVSTSHGPVKGSYLCLLSEIFNLIYLLIGTRHDEVITNEMDRKAVLALIEIIGAAVGPVKVQYSNMYKCWQIEDYKICSEGLITS